MERYTDSKGGSWKFAIEQLGSDWKAYIYTQPKRRKTFTFWRATRLYSIEASAYAGAVTMVEESIGAWI